MRLPQIAIVGAGPIGLEAAALLQRCGFPVCVYERGRVGEHLRQWGHVRMFSPWGLNVSAWGRHHIAPGDAPRDDALLTGDELRQAYLEPLARALAPAIYEQTTVIAIGRHRVGKQDEIGRASRQDGGFRLLVRDDQGERIESANVVLDCSGVYGQHRWLGAGGIPCPGERELLSQQNYTLPDILGRDRARFAGCVTLVAGAGYSAATAVANLAELASHEPNTRAIWLTRRASETPIACIPDDPLCERATLTATVNRLATMRGSCITWRPGMSVQVLSRHTDGRRFRIAISPMTDAAAIQSFDAIDEVLALVGYRPDGSLHEELQVHQCYASQGPMKLAAALLGETSADCLKQSGQGIDLLRNPEPGFFILGAKSYGRDSRFLLKVGIEQVRAVAAELCREYNTPCPLEAQG
jgi:2-polyprenyl-6-methoxyphenol hydroxylase-like FAD-dependent oxidoreductase